MQADPWDYVIREVDSSGKFVFFPEKTNSEFRAGGRAESVWTRWRGGESIPQREDILCKGPGVGGARPSQQLKWPGWWAAAAGMWAPLPRQFKQAFSFLGKLNIPPSWAIRVMPRFHHGRADAGGMRQNSAFMGPRGAWWAIPEADWEGSQSSSGPTSPLMTRAEAREGVRLAWGLPGVCGARERQVCGTQHSTFFPRDLAMVEPRGPADLMSLCRQHPREWQGKLERGTHSPLIPAVSDAGTGAA